MSGEIHIYDPSLHAKLTTTAKELMQSCGIEAGVSSSMVEVLRDCGEFSAAMRDKDRHYPECTKIDQEQDVELKIESTEVGRAWASPSVIMDRDPFVSPIPNIVPAIPIDMKNTREFIGRGLTNPIQHPFCVEEAKAAREQALAEPEDFTSNTGESNIDEKLDNLTK